MAEVAFVMSRRQNYFFRELVDALAFELERHGIGTTISFDGFPPEREGLAYMLVPPHEYFRLEGERTPPQRELLERTVFLCAEQPGTSFFVDDARLCPSAHAVFDISPHAVAEFKRWKIPARHLPLGYTEIWDRFDAEAPRPVDLLFLGCESERRSKYLGAYAESLARFRSRLVLSDNSAPNYADSRSFLRDEEKWRLLASSRVLLNLHQGDEPYFESLRVVQAMLNGCAVVSEHSVDVEPLEPGEHLVLARPEALGGLAAALLDDEGMRTALAGRAYRFLREQRPLAEGVAHLAEAIDSAGRTPIRHPVPRPVAGDELDEADGDDWTRRFRPPALTLDPDVSVLRRALKDVALELIEQRRRLERVVWEARGLPVANAEVVMSSPTYAGVEPRVSVLVSLYNYAHHVGVALDSVAASSFSNWELVVVDDGSTDESLDSVRTWIEDHAYLPAMLVRHPVNRGLPVARNTAIEFARGDLSFILDADNVLFPHGLERLVSALDSDADATFAYGMLQRWTGTEAIGLSSRLPWEPARLRGGNYIDAMALIRTSALRDTGGYTTARALYGWEDYELWCRFAEQGRRAAFVQEIVGRYRVSPNSMLALTNISWASAYSMLIERYPRLMEGVAPPL